MMMKILLVIVSGNQGEPLDALEKMVRKHHKDIKIKDTDTVLITFTPSPGMEVGMYQNNEPNCKSWSKSINF